MDTMYSKFGKNDVWKRYLILYATGDNRALGQKEESYVHYILQSAWNFVYELVKVNVILYYAREA